MRKSIVFTVIVIALGIGVYFLFPIKQDNSEDLDFGNANTQFRNVEQTNLSPYAMFGDSSVVLLTDAEKYSQQFIEIFNTDKLSATYKIEFDQKTQKIRFYNKKGKLLKEELLAPEMIAKFLAVDPRAEKYAGWSPYNYVMGNPIRNIDPNGDTVRVVGAGDNNTFDWTPGMTYTGEDAFIAQTVSALNFLDNNNIGNIADFPNDDNERIAGNVITDFAAGGKYGETMVEVVQTTGHSISYADPQYNQYSKTILFNPSEGLRIPNQNDQQAGMIAPSTILAHEFGHVWFWETMPKKHAKLYQFDDPNYGNPMPEELVLKYVERPAGEALNQGVRLYYDSGTFYNTQGVNTTAPSN